MVGVSDGGGGGYLMISETELLRQDSPGLFEEVDMIRILSEYYWEKGTEFYFLQMNQNRTMCFVYTDQGQKQYIEAAK